jgi:hypothetical protein
MKVKRLLPLIAVSSAMAQTAPADFPVDATPPAAAVLQGALAGKVFAVKLADGSSWRLEYKGSGYFWINTSKGFADTGKWSTQDGKLCSEGQKIKANCNDVRARGASLLLKRESGEIIELVPQ